MTDEVPADRSDDRPPDPGGPAWIARFSGVDPTPADPQAAPWRRRRG